MMYSQFDEDQTIEEIFQEIGTTNKFFVDIGAKDGVHFSNTRKLEDEGWSGIKIDKLEFPGVIQEMITRENVNEVLKKHNVPVSFDFLSLDIDGNDYYVWEELRFVPRVVCIEYNQSIDDQFPYDPEFVWKNDKNFGTSMRLMDELAKKKGYRKHYSNIANIFYIYETT